MSIIRTNKFQTLNGQPMGTILQVQHVNTFYNESTTVDGLVNASKGITITPYFATSKIFVYFDILVYCNGTGTGGFRTGISRTINGTNAQILGSGFNGVNGHNISNYEVNWSGGHQRVPWTVIDTPATTSAITYLPMYGKYEGGFGGSAFIGNGGNQYATLTAWEIAQ